jgi:hypothetical protein
VREATPGTAVLIYGNLAAGAAAPTTLVRRPPPHHLVDAALAEGD